jgi:hypothetical protein
MERMLAGLSTRRYPVGLEPVGRSGSPSNYGGRLDARPQLIIDLDR